MSHTKNKSGSPRFQVEQGSVKSGVIKPPRSPNYQGRTGRSASTSERKHNQIILTTLGNSGRLESGAGA